MIGADGMGISARQYPDIVRDALDGADERDGRRAL